MKYQNHIDVITLQNFKKLIDTSIAAIYSDALSVDKNYIESRLLLIKVTNELWLNLKNKANETPEDIDYYNFLISITNKPEGVAYDQINNSVIYPFGKINLNPAIIKSIEIYKRQMIYGSEEFDNDALVLFKCQKNFQFMIALEERVDEFLVYSSNPKIIVKYLRDLTLRVSL